MLWWYNNDGRINWYDDVIMGMVGGMLSVMKYVAWFNNGYRFFFFSSSPLYSCYSCRIFPLSMGMACIQYQLGGYMAPYIILPLLLFFVILYWAQCLNASSLISSPLFHSSYHRRLSLPRLNHPVPPFIQFVALIDSFGHLVVVVIVEIMPNYCLWQKHCYSSINLGFSWGLLS